MMTKPDYSRYSVAELLDCKANIDKEAWPDRYQDILEQLKIKNQNPEDKEQHDIIVFANFCSELSDELSLSLDDNFIGFLGLFSTKAQDMIPSTFEGKSCPICEGSLKVKPNWQAWQVSCLACNITGTVQEVSNNC